MKKTGVIFLLLAVFGMAFVIRQGPAWAAQPKSSISADPAVLSLLKRPELWWIIWEWPIL